MKLNLDPWTQGDALVHIDASDTFTTVVIAGDRYTAVGAAKRNPRDTPNEQIGIDLAFSRALRDLADQLEEGASW